MAAFLTAGCQFEVPIHGHGDGPLTAYDGGSFSMTEPPNKSPWYGSVGATLCATEPGTRIELKRVTWEAAGGARPLAVRPWLRFVDRTTKRTTGFISASNLPWKPYGDDEPMPGKYSKKFAGAVITQSCAELDRARDAEFTELVLVVKTGKQGADITRVFIDYEVDGDSYRHVTGWHIITCGKAIEARESDTEDLGGDDWCPPDRHEHYYDE